MALPNIIEWIGKIKDILSKIGSKIITPKNPEEAKNLSDASFRQNNIFSRTQNIFVIDDKSSGKGYIADINNIPPEVLERLRKQFSKENETDEESKIRLIVNDFKKPMEDYSSFLEKLKERKEAVNKVMPYLEPNYKSILQLSVYVGRLLDEAKHNEAQKVKYNIANMYGKDGRKLCNLYLQGYITEMVTYLSEFIEDADSEKLRNYLSELIKIVIKDSEYVFFINPRHDEVEIVNKIIAGMNLKVDYIALHSAGTSNIRKTENIIKAVTEEKIEELGYTIKQEHPPITTSLCPTFNVFITKSKLIV